MHRVMAPQDRERWYCNSGVVLCCTEFWLLTVALARNFESSTLLYTVVAAQGSVGTIFREHCYVAQSLAGKSSQ